MAKSQISPDVNPSKPTTSWFIHASLVLCCAFAGCASAQLAEPIDPLISSVVGSAPGTSTSLQSAPLSHVTYCNDGGNGSPEALRLQYFSSGVAASCGNPYGLVEPGRLETDASVGVPNGNPQVSASTSPAPGAIAKSSAMPLKLPHKSAFSIEPDYLPSWVTDQPLAYQRYGAAPAVVTLHFGHK